MIPTSEPAPVYHVMRPTHRIAALFGCPTNVLWVLRVISNVHHILHLFGPGTRFGTRFQ